jgi:TRAP-type C4-dicarboxylate transport system permease small subunit
MGRRRSRKSIGIEGLFDMFFELAGYFWQVGAAVTVVLLFCAYGAYGWAEAWSAQGDTSARASAIVANFAWAVYAVPFMFFALAVMFGIRTWKTYSDQHRF